VARVSEGVRFLFPTRLPDPLRGSERPLFIVSVLIVSPTWCVYGCAVKAARTVYLGTAWR